MKNHIPAILALALLLAGCKSQAPVTTPIFESQSFDIQLNNLTSQMVKSLTEERKTKIAIMEFPDLNGNISELGKFIPEELTTRLFMTRKFEVLERQLLNRVLAEQNLGLTGLIDANSAAQIGKLLGVDAIVTGTITDMGNTIRLNARIIATGTGGVFAVASVSIDKEPHLAAMMNRFHTPQAPLRVNDETAVRQSQPPVQPEPIAEPPQRRSPPALTKAIVDEFEFEVVGTAFTADKKILIDILITNTSNRDREISILHDSNMFDNLGQEYPYSERKIGQKYMGIYSNLNHLFIPGVPTRISMEYANGDPNAESVALLNLKVGNLRGGVVQLRNFKLNK